MLAILVRFANAHLSDDETVAKMGHPGFCFGFEVF
jgi:hypothetical protein